MLEKRNKEVRGIWAEGKEKSKNGKEISLKKKRRGRRIYLQFSKDSTVMATLH